MSMREYEEAKNIVIPKEQEEMMDIICDAWEECRSLESCKDCQDRPLSTMRMMMCTALKYTRKLVEAGYTNRQAADVAPVVRGQWITEFDDLGWLKHTCTVCGYVKRTDVHVSLGWNYCPICGQKADGGAD